MKLTTQIALFASLYSLCFYAQAQTCTAEIAQTTPTAYFTVHNDGTVTDKTTGLMWKVCIEGQTSSLKGNCTGTAATPNWQQALQIPDSLNVSGGYAAHTDWRLPNVNELMSITEAACAAPAINLAIFPAITADYTGGTYWASSPVSFRSHSSHIVRFSSGSVYTEFRNNKQHVRLVRDGQLVKGGK